MPHIIAHNKNFIFLFISALLYIFIGIIVLLSPDRFFQVANIFPDFLSALQPTATMYDGFLRVTTSHYFILIGSLTLYFCLFSIPLSLFLVFFFLLFSSSSGFLYFYFNEAKLFISLFFSIYNLLILFFTLTFYLQTKKNTPLIEANATTNE